MKIPKLNPKQVFAGLGLLLASLAIYALLFGLWPRYFDIEWDEEVKLHDGRMIVVHVRNYYERRIKNLARNSEDGVALIKKEIAFQVSPGNIHKISTNLPIAYLGEFDGKWYLVVSGQGPFGSHSEESPLRWGEDFTTREQRIAVLEDGVFVPISWDFSPSEIVVSNLMRSAFWSEFLTLNNGRLTLQKKEDFNRLHPSPSGQSITRPLRFYKLQGDKK